MFPLLALLVGLLSGGYSGLAAQSAYSISVDFRENGPAIDRALFSLVNYQRVYADFGKRARDAFIQLGPAGTHARTETLIDRMEPVNDNEDPEIFNMSGFQFDTMYRFVDDFDGKFYDDMVTLGMEPVLLLCYNTPWLSINGQLNTPPRDTAEWAEWAAAVIERVNGGKGTDRGYSTRLKYVEIWNEPSSNGPYWNGPMERYYELFNVVADRIHRDYPGVLVGGPTVLGSHTVFMQEFIERCGDKADFFSIHFYNNDAYLVTKRIKSWNELIQKKTGKTGPLMMITEADDYNLNDAAEKQRYLMVRQMELLGIQDHVLGFHQFSLPYYQESPGRVFGLVRQDGRPVDKNYWSYWAFRNLRGLRAATTVLGSGGVPVDDGKTRTQALPVYVVGARDGDRYSAVVYNDRLVGTAASLRITLSLPPAAMVRTVRIDRVIGLERTLAGYSTLAKGLDSLSLEISSQPGEAFSFQVVPASTGPLEVLIETERSGTPLQAALINGSQCAFDGRIVLYTLDSLGRRLSTGAILATGLSIAPNSVSRIQLATIPSDGLPKILVLEDGSGKPMAESLAF